MSDRAFHYWQQSQQDPGDAPDIRILWDKTARARRTHMCDRCNEPINVGEKYESVGLREDGVFRHEKRHFAADHYPSGCPKYRARDLAEAEEQFRADQQQYFPLPTDEEE